MTLQDYLVRVVDTHYGGCTKFTINRIVDVNGIGFEIKVENETNSERFYYKGDTLEKFGE
jgi:hypothetical protein